MREEGQPHVWGRTGIVDEDVNGAILLHRGLHTSPRKVFCSDIASKGDSIASLRLDLLGDLQGRRLSIDLMLAVAPNASMA